ncbi:MAG TPA: ABC transporter ATP-binding protein [Candidatus Omnitrophota bacterium]|nr:ABC transporter ATP-binding protein [Candidatus Omnitrophota bacterium]
MSDPAFVIENLNKTYRVYKHPLFQLLSFLCPKMIPQSAYAENHALSDVSLNIPRGSKIGIIGKNGSGKSTLLKLISGRVQPTSGKLKVDGRVNALLELGTGFHPEFTGRENVFSALAYMGVVGKAAQDKFSAIVSFSELETFIDQPVRVYSTGMYMRLAFSIATSIEPEILLVDEALSVGDTYFSNKCLDKMKHLSEDSNTTIIYVSHNMSSLSHLCDRIVWLDKGAIKAVGNPIEILNLYDLSVREEEEKRMAALVPQSAKTQTEKEGALSEALPGVNRPGTGLMRVTGVSFEDDRGQKKHHYGRGEAFNILFSYRSVAAGRPLPLKVICGISRSDGLLMTATIFEVAQSQQEGKIKVRFPELLLNAGNYFVTILLYEQLDLEGKNNRFYVIDQFLYDAVIRAFEFKVEGSPPIETTLFNHPSEVVGQGGEAVTLLNPLRTV